MYLRNMLVLFIFFVILFSLGNSEDHSINKFLVVATTEQPPACRIENDLITKKQFQELISTLHENITNYLQKNKQTITDEPEHKLNEKLFKMKQEIIDQTQNTVKEQLSKIKKEIIESLQTVKIPRDCKEVQKNGFQTSGVYQIRPSLARREFSVFCDMTTRGGGWTYVLNRLDGSQDFFLNWNDYEDGFGTLSREHWIGLEHLYYLTNSKPTELLVELVDWDLKKVHAHYSKFKIGKDCDGYKFKALGEYTGDAGDSFTGQLGNKFTARDLDQDTYSGNCATLYPGAWWHGQCFASHLTGKYAKHYNVSYASGIHWNLFHGLYYSLKEARMMIRPVNI